jgi:hypothetical protein
MKKLSEVVLKNGYKYTQIKRGIRGVVYSQKISDPDLEDSAEYFEVFKIKISPPKVVFGVELPEKEKFPSDEDFGKWAWVFKSREKAFERYEKIENGEIEEESDPSR